MNQALLTCSCCKIEKSQTEFWVRFDRKKGFRSKCKSCHKESHRKWRKANIKRRRKSLQKWVAENPKRARQNWRNSDNKRRNRIKNWVHEMKSDPCMDCGKTFPPFCMDFDHRDPQIKNFCIGYMVSKRMSKEAILEEIKKCDLVCACCHRIRTNNQQTKRKKIDAS
jgi:hypothetical protein